MGIPETFTIYMMAAMALNGFIIFINFWGKSLILAALGMLLSIYLVFQFDPSDPKQIYLYIAGFLIAGFHLGFALTKVEHI